MPALTAILLAGAAALSPADAAAVEAAVTNIYAGYARPDAGESPPDAAWLVPVYSRETMALIAEWQRVMPQDELDGLNDFDWFCECQDWDPAAFRMRILGRKAKGPDEVVVTVALDIGWDTQRQQRLRFLREGGRWRLDDLFSEDFARGLKRKLRKTIAEDKAL